jgi:hypothetical protein
MSGGVRRCTLAALAVAELVSPNLLYAGTGVPDFQQWTELDALIGLNRRMNMTVLGQARFSQTLANPVFTGSGLELSYRYDAWTFAIGYRHQITGYHTDEPQVTQIALLMGTYAHEMGRSTLAIRLRVENTISAFSNPWRIRLRGEYRWATPGLTPIAYLFANDEIYYRFQDDVLYRNRFQTGVDLGLTRRSSMRLYFERQDDKFNAPGALNVVGVLATIAFE